MPSLSPLFYDLGQGILSPLSVSTLSHIEESIYTLLLWASMSGCPVSVLDGPIPQLGMQVMSGVFVRGLVLSEWVTGKAHIITRCQ